MPTGEDAGGGAGARRPVPEVVQPGMLRGIIEISANGRPEVSVVAGRVGDEVVAPIIKHAAVRVGEAEGNVGFEFAGARLETENGRVVVAHDAPGGLDLRAMKHAVAQVN